jgi:hypothetical protein
MQRRRANQIKRCDSSQGDTSMNRIQSPLTIAKHASIAAAMFVVVLTFAGVANAVAMSSAHAHKVKSGQLTITAPTEVGGTILQPGEYEVKEANSPTGPVIEFVAHHDGNELAVGEQLAQVDEEEVVARVRFTEQALSSPPKHTQLILASNAADASGLQIRGNDVSYAFAPSQMADKAGTTAVCTNVGQQE